SLPLALSHCAHHLYLHSFPTRRSSDLHVLNYPASDLMDVVTGKISFQQALSLRAEKVIRSERRGRHATRPPIKTWLTRPAGINIDRKSTRLNSSHQIISYAVFCLKKKK